MLGDLDMKTIIMAGGRSSRFGENLEKPLLRLGGMTLLERTVNAVLESRADDCLVALSESTPLAREFAEREGFSIIDTPGVDYHEDVKFLSDHLGNYLSVNVDIPFIGSEYIDLLQSKIEERSIACIVPLDIVQFKISERSTFEHEDGKRYVWVGLNYVTSLSDTDYLVIDNPLLALNVNTVDDLLLAAQLISQYRNREQ